MQLSAGCSAATDLTLFSPRASWMGHHFGNELISRYWTEHSNDLIYRVQTLFPDNFVGVCQLPQSPGVPPGNPSPSWSGACASWKLRPGAT